METVNRIERALKGALASHVDGATPQRLAAALRHAVFPAGARIRPRLCLAVAAACGDDDPALVDATAAALELLHCASLVHDDLPCFDDALIRRGKLSVHRAFGERMAVLAGDALIVLAFQTLAAGAARHPQRLASLIRTVGQAVGVPGGIVAGQAWECESHIVLADYQRAKTGALFIGATTAGAEAAGADPAPWRMLGDRLGAAYQVADDIRDVAASSLDIGKPVGRDAALGRPSAADEMGLNGAIRHFQRLIEEAAESIPECPGASNLRALIRHESERLVPEEMVRLAA